MCAALVKEYPDALTGPNSASELEAFKRKWIYYLFVAPPTVNGIHRLTIPVYSAYSEIGFTMRILGGELY